MAETLSAEELKRLKGLGCIRDKRGADTFSVRVPTGNGRLTSAQHRSLAEAAERFGEGALCLTTRLSFELQGVPYANIEPLRDFLAENGFAPGGTGPKVRPIVACKGTVCPHGTIDTFGVSERLHRRFYEGWHDTALPHKFKIAVGGCPNNCVKPDLNDFGVVGWRGGFRVYIGGRWGKTGAQGRPLSRIIASEEELTALLERTLRYYQASGLPGERFADTIARIGFETVEATLLGE